MPACVAAFSRDCGIRVTFVRPPAFFVEIRFLAVVVAVLFAAEFADPFFAGAIIRATTEGARNDSARAFPRLLADFFIVFFLQPS
jgi:hypothetical protein